MHPSLPVLPTRRRRLDRRGVSLTIAATLLVNLLGVPQALASPNTAKPSRPGTQQTPEVPVRPVAVKSAPSAAKAASALDKPKPVWPAAGTTFIDVPPTRPSDAKVGGLPVRAQRADQPVATDPQRVRLEVFDRKTTQAAAVRGVLMRVDRADGRGGEGKVDLTVDYGRFATAYGADWASRLRLVALPECAVSDPDDAACAGTPLASDNDLKARTVSASLPITARGALVALSAGAKGPAGSYAASSLTSSATWTAGGNSGAFTWNYPMRTPPSLGGPAPSLELGYSSQSVDGRHAASNNQPSWIGEGFEDSAGGYIERTYVQCDDDRDGDKNNNDAETGDLCWETDNATLSLNGATSELLYNAGEKRWHMRSDDGAKIKRETGAINGDRSGEHWVVTTTDGTQYWFGLNQLPGWSANKSVTNSTLNAPVFSNEPSEPCYQPKFADSDCVQAWRWNLDYVVDVHGNSMSYWYTKETNHYLRNMSKTDKAPYDRGSWLDHISYGTRNVGGVDSVLNTPAPMRVNFGVDHRCLGGCGTHDETHWPDTPWDQECTANQSDCDNYAPTFWSTKRLETVTTQVRKGSGYLDVDRWTLGHDFPDPGDTTRAGLWLKRLGHDGLVGGTASVPDIEFTGVQLANRVDTIDFAAAMNWWRIAKIRNESGGTINVTYFDQDCQPKDKPAPHTNTRRCYPVIWKPEGYANPVTDWFNKYVVKTIYTIDHTGGTQPQGSPRVVHTYEYLDGAAWHYADDDGLVAANKKTWSSFRGYGKVVVTTGDPGEQTATETRYFRGMHGDRQAPAGGTRTVSIDGIADEDWYAGMVRETRTLNGPDGPVINRKTNTPWHSEPTASRTFNGDTVTARFSRVSVSRDFTARDAGRSERVTRVDTTYDDLGMAAQVEDLGDESITGDERCTKTDYSPRNDTAWLMESVHRTRIYALKCADTTRTLSADDIVEDNKNYFDDHDFGVPPTRGLTTKVEGLAEWTAGVPNFRTAQTSVYDIHGRITEAVNAAGALTKTAYTPRTDGPVTQTVTTNPLGHTITATIEPAWGTRIATVDANDKRTDLSYDALGRLTAVWEPGRSKDTDSAHFSFTYRIRNDAATAIGTSRIRPDGGYTTTWSLLDGQLRPRQTQEPSGSGGRLLTETFYDSTGRKAKTFGTYHTSGTAGPNLVTATERAFVPNQSRTVYDGANRPVAEIFQPYDKERWRTRMYYAGDRTDVTPPSGGTPQSTVVDARGETSEIRKYKGSTPTPGTAGSWEATAYKYDRKGLLERVTDAAGNAWTYKYDIRGRQIEADDPDKGVTTSSYDNAGRLTSTTDANGKTLAFGYDLLDRKRVAYADRLGGPLRAQWTYDTIAKGKLSQTTRMIGSAPYQVKTVGYTDSYQSTGTQVVIPDSEAGLGGTYTFAHTYHPDGSVATSSLPGGHGLPVETLTYKYDTLGRPSALNTLYDTNTSHSYVASSVYNALGQLDQYKLHTGAATGKAVWQTFGRELETGRLTSLRTDRETAPASLSNRSYAYDDAGKITSIRDQAPDPVDDVQCFDYDFHERMTEVWTPASGDCAQNPSAATLGGPAQYWQSWSFDTAGNRATQVDHDSAGDRTTTNIFGEGTNRPHAVTGTTGARTGTYTYDAVGNMKTRTTPTAGTQTLTWDPDGTLTSSVDATGTTSYLYDADGARLIKRDPTGKTLYLPGQEIRWNSTTKTTSCTRFYTFAGDLVATRTATGLTWSAGDHQGTAQVEVNADTQDSTVRRQTPYGETRGTAPLTWTTDKGFVGGTRDDTGLTQLGARLYDPVLGGFVSTDPLLDLSNPEHLNPYAYGFHNPILLSDPTGTLPEEVVNGLITPQEIAAIQNSGGKSKGSNKPKKKKDWEQGLEKAVKEVEKKYKAPINDLPLQLREIALQDIENIACKKFPSRCMNILAEMSRGLLFVVNPTVVKTPNKWGSTRDVADALKSVADIDPMELLEDELSSNERDALKDGIAAGDNWKLRMWYGHAVHRATMKELNKRFPGKFEYNTSYGPDFTDKRNGAKIEVTTVGEVPKHMSRAAKNPDYERTTYVRYGMSNALYHSMLSQLGRMPNEAATG